MCALTTRRSQRCFCRAQDETSLNRRDQHCSRRVNLLRHHSCTLTTTRCAQMSFLLNLNRYILPARHDNQPSPCNGVSFPNWLSFRFERSENFKTFETPLSSRLRFHLTLVNETLLPTLRHGHRIMQIPRRTDQCFAFVPGRSQTRQHKKLGYTFPR